jgi:hypothetical protein
MKIAPLVIGASELVTLSGAWGKTTMDMLWLLFTGIFFILALIIVPAVFKGLGLASNNQAMGLPDGSIRSVIALALVLLFAVLPVLLFNRVADSGKMLPPIAGLSTEAKAKAETQYATFNPIFVEAADAAHPDVKTYTMYLRQPEDAAGVDFAKQMLVLLGTLATSVASFYFGSNTASSAHTDAARIAADATSVARGGAGGKPVLTDLTTKPTPVTRDANGVAAFTLNLSGTNLNDVKTVRIKSGADNVSATAFTNDAGVTCEVNCKPTAAQATDWDVIVVDALGRESDALRGRLNF